MHTVFTVYSSHLSQKSVKNYSHFARDRIDIDDTVIHSRGNKPNEQNRIKTNKIEHMSKTCGQRSRRLTPLTTNDAVELRAQPEGRTYKIIAGWESGVGEAARA